MATQRLGYIYKKFSGKKYRIGKHGNKRECQVVANKYRKQGIPSRVTPYEDHYATWHYVK